MAENNFFTYVVDKDTTLSDLSSSKLSVLKGVDSDKVNFLKFKGTTSESNIDRIWKRYSILEQNIQENINDKAIYELDVIKKGTVILIPEIFVNVDFIAFDGFNLFSKIDNTQGYYSDYLEMLKEDGYKPSDEIKLLGSASNSLHYNDLDCSVWIWSKALNKVINVSDYVEVLGTTVDGSANSFRITLSSIKDLHGIQAAQTRLDYFNLKDNNYFYDNFQSNDVVFLRFEKLIDKDFRSNSEDISEVELPNNYYDFIGFIDSVNSIKMFDSTSSSLEIRGRGLNKILEEDGSYFYPLLFVENSSKNFINASPAEDDKWFKRNFFASPSLGGSGAYNSQFLAGVKSIKDSIGFIVNQLSNLGVCDDSLFSGYEDRRTKFIRLSGMSNKDLEDTEAKGIWQIVDFKFDDKLSNRAVSANYFQNPNSQLISMINNICHDPFVEFFTDTYRDKLNVIIRQPPFTRTEILNCLKDTIPIEDSDIIYEDFAWSQKYYTSYHLDINASFSGIGDSLKLAIIPIIYFPKIAEIFGNRRLVKQSKYIPIKSTSGKGASLNLEDYKKRAVDDLKYMIQSNCYDQFTENGTLVIKGDRRIKAKTWIKLGYCGKIGYVESVSNNLINGGASPDRTTTLSLSKIMVEKYVIGHSNEDTDKIKDVPYTEEEKSFIRSSILKGRVASIKGGDSVTDKWEDQLVTSVAVTPKKALTYWSIVDIDLIIKTLQEKIEVDDGVNKNTASVSKTTAKMNYGLNDDAFDFFLKRKQLK